MQRLTLHEVNEQHDGRLPLDAVLRADEDEGLIPPEPPSTPKRRTRSERFAALNAFTDFALCDLTSAQAKVWLILFRDTKGTGTARTSQTDIARRAGLKPRMVRYALKALEAKGMVQVVRRGRLIVGPSVYRVHPTGNMRQSDCPD